jgi:hypothetical protein
MMHKQYVCCLVMVTVFMVVVCSIVKGGDQDGVTTKIHGFLPKWKMGDVWSVSISSIATERVPPRRENLNCYMSVDHVPKKDETCFVLRLLVDQNKECLFFVLDSRDLSMRELRKLEGNRMESSQEDYKNVAWRDAKVIAKYPGGVPVIIRTSFVKMAFPVLKSGAEAAYIKGNEYTVVQKHAIEIGVKSRLTVDIVKEAKLENARERLSQDNVDFRLVWEYGAPWWQTCVAFSEDEYRIESPVSIENIGDK